jgi:hypothetical protein
MEKKPGIPLVHIDKLELSNTLEILIRPGTLQHPNAGEVSIHSDKLVRLILWRL